MLPTFCLNFILIINFMSPIKRDHSGFLGARICLCFAPPPRLLFLPLEIIVCRGGKEGEDGEKTLAGSTWPGKPFLSSVQAFTSSCLSFGGPSQLHRSRSLCNTDSPKQRQSLAVTFLFPSPSCYPLLCGVVRRAAGNPGKLRRRKEAAGCGSKFWLRKPVECLYLKAKSSTVESHKYFLRQRPPQ